MEYQVKNNMYRKYCRISINADIKIIWGYYWVNYLKNSIKKLSWRFGFKGDPIKIPSSNKY